MESAWEKVNGRKFALVEYRDKKGELRPCYSLTKTECLYIATKFNDEARAKLVLRWEHLEFGDINMDGDIDNDDLGLIKDYINGEAGDDFNKDIADTNGDSLNAITDVFLPRNLEESGKEVIFADRKEKGKINMEVNMTEQNKQYRLTSLEEPTDEMLFELMAGVENIAKISSAKAEAEKKRRLQAVAEEILAWRANQ